MTSVEDMSRIVKESQEIIKKAQNDEMRRLIKKCNEIIKADQDANKDRAARERSKGV